MSVIGRVWDRCVTGITAVRIPMRDAALHLHDDNTGGIEMKRMLLVGLIAGLATIAISGETSAATSMSCATNKHTANMCKQRDCARLFDDNLAACRELPANKACEEMARSQKRQCDQFCDEQYPKEVDGEEGCADK